MNKIGVIPIQANTPQAKGKVERLFKTLQDRLVSEMRIRGVVDIEEANKYLNEHYIEEFNNKFAVNVSDNCFRALSTEIDLKEVFCMVESRVISNGNTFSLNGIKYCLETDRCMAKSNVEIRHYPDHSMKAFIQNEQYKFYKIDELKVAC